MSETFFDIDGTLINKRYVRSFECGIIRCNITYIHLNKFGSLTKRHYDNGTPEYHDWLKYYREYRN